MKMKLVLVLSCVACVCADGKVLHDSFAAVGCSESDGVSVLTLDGEEIWHADFARETGVDTLPDFVQHISFEGLYSLAADGRKVCKENLPKVREGLKDFPTALDPPYSFIYSAHSVEPGLKNTLICRVSGFCPAPVKVHWTRNGQHVSEGTSINVPFPNKDQTFSQISRLDFIPQLGDIYSCTVEHVALKEPQTRIWDVDVHASLGMPEAPREALREHPYQR
ncbi:mamu class II histocompatibility antigen, DR alpha chain-like [Nematolebias whitei]|uniref:mamu class II histocompatibility antigen, DR alpha chain-like n=1 Tax=Nematolebias whitei TaxID=451745 RepID=UPI001896C309|nr:mamu class II histocompatibility antigen, DR alpha chain-like [Nematolebias whitei]